MGEAFGKAISREAHAYQGVVYDLELCDDGGECASLVARGVPSCSGRGRGDRGLAGEPSGDG